jgi:hypothetical protein
MTGSAFSDDYIVRIYRHSRRNPRRFVGTVEEVGTEGKRAFATIDELWDILVRRGRRRELREKTRLEIKKGEEP